MLVLLFVLIVVFLYYNAELMEKLRLALIKTSVEKKDCSCPEQECEANCPLNVDVMTEKTPLLNPKKQKPFSIQFNHNYKDLSFEVIDMSLEGNNNFFSSGLKLEDSENGSCTGMMYRLLTAPVRLLMFVTIPKASQKYFAFTFVLSIGWMALLSYLTVTNVEFFSELI